MSGALALMMARARFNHLALEGITYIGANVGAGTTSGGATSATVDLPAGSQAGDWALITLNTFSTTVAGLSLTSPTAAQVLAPQNYTSTSGYQYLAAYLYQLTSGDITSGSLTVTTSAVSTQTVGLEVLRASGTLMLDVAGALGKGNIAASSTGNMTAPGVSAAAGAVVFYIAGLVTGGGGNLSFGSPPVGFNLDFNAYYQPSSPQALCHRPPTAAGATGDATMTATKRFASDWGAVLLSLKQAVPSIVITYDFSDGTVGEAYVGSITATNVGGATGAITLTNDALPGGYSLGTRVDNGDGSYTWDVTGTPTTDTDTTPVTTDFEFDNGNGQTASYSQVWSIAAASATVAYWDPARTNSDITLSGTPTNSIATLTGAPGWKSACGAISHSSGKVYFELSVGSNTMIMGVGDASANINSYPGSNAHSWGWRSSGARYGSGQTSNAAQSYLIPGGARLMFALDLDTGELYLGVNGTWASGTPGAGGLPQFTGITGDIVPMAAPYAKAYAATLYQTSGELSYAPPTGFSTWSRT